MGKLLLCRVLLIISFAILTLTLSLRIFFAKVIFFTLLDFFVKVCHDLVVALLPLLDKEVHLLIAGGLHDLNPTLT